MKKVFIIFLLIILSGCAVGKQAGTVNEKTANSPSTYNEGEVMSRINDINNGATPKVGKSDNKDLPPLPPPPPPPMQNQKKAELKNLAKDYKSAVIKTSLGDITIKFYSEDSPNTVNNFLNLAEEGFYDGTKFHRIISDFMIQGGDPLSKDDSKKALWGTGGPGYKFDDEFNDHPLQRGSLAMANSGPNTNGSQFFIVTKDFTPWLDGKHTNFGEVDLGMETVEKIEAVITDMNDKPLEDVVILSIELIK